MLDYASIPSKYLLMFLAAYPSCRPALVQQAPGFSIYEVLPGEIGPEFLTFNGELIEELPYMVSLKTWLQQADCTCGDFQDSGTLCRHIAAVVYHRRSLLTKSQQETPATDSQTAHSAHISAKRQKILLQAVTGSEESLNVYSEAIAALRRLRRMWNNHEWQAGFGQQDRADRMISRPAYRVIE